MAFAAKNVTKDEIVNQAIDAVSAALVQRILTAKTPEDRESKFQEWDAHNRVWDFLRKLALQADK